MPLRLLFHFQVFLLFCSLLCSVPASTYAQQTSEQQYDEQMPVFPGGIAAFQAFLTDSLRYPPLALRERAQGRVVIGFTIDSAGRNTNIHVQQGARADLDAEALRLARRLTRVRWQPGRQNGRPVEVTMTTAINFYFQDRYGAPLAMADSLDLHPGPALVLPLLSWSASHPTIPADKGVIYGSCLQRLGFGSGGVGQYVRLINLTTGKAFRLNVKPVLRSRQENNFCYALLHYEYTDSKWSGLSMHVESIHKELPTNTLPLAATRYQFVVEPGQLHYVGTWNFSAAAEGAQFIQEKSRLDDWFTGKYKRLTPAAALLAVPK